MFQFKPQQLQVFQCRGGAVSTSSITAEIGTPITVSGNTITIGNQTITATASAGYTFKEWQNVPTSVTANMSFKAIFEQNAVMVEISFYCGTGVVFMCRIVINGEEFSIGDAVLVVPDTATFRVVDGSIVFSTGDVVSCNCSNGDVKPFAYNDQDLHDGAECQIQKGYSDHQITFLDIY